MKFTIVRLEERIAPTLLSWLFGNRGHGGCGSDRGHDHFPKKGGCYTPPAPPVCQPVYTPPVCPPRGW